MYINISYKFLVDAWKHCLFVIAEISYVKSRTLLKWLVSAVAKTQCLHPSPDLMSGNVPVPNCWPNPRPIMNPPSDCGRSSWWSGCNQFRPIRRRVVLISTNVADPDDRAATVALLARQTSFSVRIIAIAHRCTDSIVWIRKVPASLKWIPAWKSLRVTYCPVRAPCSQTSRIYRCSTSISRRKSNYEYNKNKTIK